MNIKDCIKQREEQLKREHAYLYNKRRYIYRRLKAKFYNVTSVLLVFLLHRVRFSPNVLSSIYAVVSILGAVLIAIPLKWAIFAGIIIFYFRPILDWADGLLARVTNQVSFSGHILDEYGSFMGWIAFWAGIGIYVANKAESLLFYRLSPLIPAIFASDIFVFAHIRYLQNNQQLVKFHSSNERVKDENNGYSKSADIFRIVKAINTDFFECNATTVDFICLIILIELLFPRIFVSKYIYLIFIFWQILLFFGKLYAVVSGKWLEMKIRKNSEGISVKSPQREI